MLLSTADVAKGEAVFAKCVACHTIEQGGPNGIGPNLYGIMGKPVGKHAAGFAYSSALSGHGGDWDFANMDAWLTSPRNFANGTKMSFAGLGKGEDRVNIIAYMKANGGGPDYPAPAAPAEAAPAEGDAAAAAAVPEAEGAAAAGAVAADQPANTEATGATAN